MDAGTTYHQAPVVWWENFVPQLALVACEYGLNTWDDADFNECVRVFLELSKLN